MYWTCIYLSHYRCQAMHLVCKVFCYESILLKSPDQEVLRITTLIKVID